ncbi:MAG: M23 family metallopeptidase, partial [Gammaproteobacteria bacterium]|nr:M23 family metallopeptidase [Gammaproteobacteria bacterium]NIT62703.1 M23 family metallopeptidase [Gammaproteobacteria bacterium]NIV21843.1 peptidoglycan DD-metalloendopeptidase family protein [Gammaproteobacteria bacterium]NIY31283.1 peptidoglycan DD-metalloendopeptidase family protein [Gammaproteobacteria bacterium]
MRVVFIHNRRGVRKTVRLNGWARVALSICVLGLPLTTGVFLGVQLGGGKIGFLLDRSLDNLQEEVAEQRRDLQAGRRVAERKVRALSLKMSEMQARLVRLDALGERLTRMAELDDGEFDFSQVPAQGGPERPGESVPAPGLEQVFSALDARLRNREQQLGVLESLLESRRLDQRRSLAGRPVESGWISSSFGLRTDPFTGHKSWHKGLDFASRAGASVLATGAGVVTWSGRESGYGNMVEIDHGDGFVTRYAHNQENRVDVGQLVQRGQVIAAMGSTGRATGPHLHFEVYKNGRAVD